MGTDLLEARYTVVADAGMARSVRELASQVPEITVVLTEQSRSDCSHLTVYRSARRIADMELRCNGLLVLPAPPGVTLHDCIIQADQHALANAKLQAFVLLEDVVSNCTPGYDSGAWNAQTIDCADGSKLTVAYPDPERWTAQMVLSKATALAALLALPQANDSPLDYLSVVVDDLLPYGLVGRGQRQLQDIAELVCAWSAGRTVDAEVEHAVAELCRLFPARVVAEAALGSDSNPPACRAVDRVLERLAQHRPVLHLVAPQTFRT